MTRLRLFPDRFANCRDLSVLIHGTRPFRADEGRGRFVSIAPGSLRSQGYWRTLSQGLTSPTKVPSGNLGRIGKTRDINYNSLSLMALRGQARRFTHQLRPMNVNRCSILSVASILLCMSSKSKSCRLLGLTSL